MQGCRAWQGGVGSGRAGRRDKAGVDQGREGGNKNATGPQKGRIADLPVVGFLFSAKE